MSDVKATVCRSVLFGVLVLLAACSGSTETAATLETLAPTTSADTSAAPSTTESTTSTTTTSTTVVEVEQPENVYGDYELTWAEEGTELADVERAFWRGEDVAIAARVNVSKAMLESAFAGEALQWEIEEIDRIVEGGWKIEAGDDEYEIQFIAKVGENMAQVQVCRFDKSVWFESSGEIVSDGLLPYETSWLASLSRSPDGEWFVVGGASDFDRPLKEGARPSCFSEI